MKIAIYPGTFDPITNGHIDILTKAAGMFDIVILAVAVFSNKKTMFTTEERIQLCSQSVKDISNVEVDKFDGLVVDYAQTRGAHVMIRGLRAVSDFEYELQLALMNKRMNEDLTTVFFVPDYNYLYLNSSIVKQIITLGGNLADFVPECVKTAVLGKIKQ